jgi:hypothetical protein
LSFAQGGRVRALRIRGLGLRRGPAPEARMLYDEIGLPTYDPGAALDPATEADK